MATSLDHRPVARVDEDLIFDARTDRLSLGVFDVAVPPGSTNDVVLGAYVDLVAQRRGYRPTAPVEVRADDIDVLAGLLDLDAGDIDELIAEILGAPQQEAVGLADRLRARKLAIGLAAAATGLFVLGTVGLGIVRDDDRADPAPATSTSAPAATPTTDAVTTSTAAVPLPPITETPDGVGLIPPATITHD